MYLNLLSNALDCFTFSHNYYFKDGIHTMIAITLIQCDVIM